MKKIKGKKKRNSCRHHLNKSCVIVLKSKRHRHKGQSIRIYIHIFPNTCSNMLQPTKTKHFLNLNNSSHVLFRKKTLVMYKTHLIQKPIQPNNQPS